MGNGPISEKSEQRITIAIAVAFIALMPSLVLGALLWNEIRVRTDANHDLIKQVQHNEAAQEKLRKEARIALRRADISNCHSDETVKARLREIVRFKPEEVAQTLKQLGIDPTSPQGQSLTTRARENSAEAVKALRARDCSMLPDPSKPFRDG